MKDYEAFSPLLRSGDFRVQSRRSLGRQMVRNGFGVIASRSLGRMIDTVVGRKPPSVPRPPPGSIARRMIDSFVSGQTTG